MTDDYDHLEVFQLVRYFFDGNHKKAVLWMKTKNPLLGGAAPIWMVKCGRGEKLLKFVKEALRDNEQPKSQEKRNG